MMTRRLARLERLIAICLVMAGSACSEDRTDADSGIQDARPSVGRTDTGPSPGSPDAQPSADAGEPADAQSFADATMAMDSGGPPPGPDATAPIDSGAMDASVSEDATSLADATPLADAGPVTNLDALVNPDATAPPDAGGSSCNCAPNQYCQYRTPLSCGGPGQCVMRPVGCNRILDPVCGCDGNDYSNECVANRSGVDIDYRGRCDCRSNGCSSTTHCQPCQTPNGGVTYVCLPQNVAC